MTKDDITKIDQLLQKRLQENNLQLRHKLKNDIKTEVDPLHERLDAQREQITNLSAQLSRKTNDITELIRDIIIPKLEQHNEQIAQLK